MYSPDKILQEISYLLSLNGNRMNLLKLMKELYLIDRASIAERDTSVSGDIFSSMPHGPVLSQTLNMCYEIPSNAWGKFLDKIEAPYFPDIQLRKPTSYDRLSAKDKMYIEEVSDKFRKYTPKQIENYTHGLPEWKNPGKSSFRIRYYDVMKALGKDDKEISEAKAEYEMISDLSRLES